LITVLEKYTRISSRFSANTDESGKIDLHFVSIAGKIPVDA